MNITVGRKGPGAHYIGRGSALGNPFVMHHEGMRDEVCNKYQQWFDAKVAAQDEAVMTQLRRIYREAQQGPVVLGCFCAPRRCHGDTIKAFLLKHA